MSHLFGTDAVERREQIFMACGLVSAACATFCASFAIVAGWHWPLFGDAGIFHYIVLAMQHGARPYTDIKDFNFPGTYLLDAVTMSLFGGTAGGERIYDLCLCLLGAAGFYLCFGNGVWARIGATIASALLVLVHLQDGLAQVGQRDFAMAAFALVACGFYIQRKSHPFFALFLYQLLVGLIFTIKPTLALLFIVPLIVGSDGPDDLTRGQKLRVSIAGFAIAPLVAWGWLFKQQACPAFYTMLTTLGAVHGQLARKGLAYLLSHGTSPVVALLAIWLVMLSVDRRAWSEDRQFLGLATVCGFISYWLQGKGLAYQRYPFLALFLALFFMEITRQLESVRWMRYLGLAACLLVALWFAPTLLHRVRTFQAVTPFESALSASLKKNGLVSSGGIQCLDTFSGCLTTLYDLRVTQATGYLYDCYLFTAQSHTRDTYRREFLATLQQTQPKALVVTDQNCFQQHAGFSRIDSWKDLSDLLADGYVLQDAWNSEEKYLLWSRPEVRPAFRVYVLRSRPGERK